MNKIIALASLVFSSQAFTYGDGDWVNMQSNGSESIDYTYTKCFYKQSLFGKFSISIVIKGSTFSCPYTIKYNPVTGKWKN